MPCYLPLSRHSHEATNSSSEVEFKGRGFRSMTSKYQFYSKELCIPKGTVHSFLILCIVKRNPSPNHALRYVLRVTGTKRQA